MPAKQLHLIAGTWSKDRFAFGGSRLKNSHAKTKRVFNPRLPLHVVLRSSQTRGGQSLLAHDRAVGRILNEQSSRNQVTLRNAANAGNHLHLLVEAPSRAHLSAFLRAIAGRIAMRVSGARKRSPGKAPFWDFRPFSRVVNRGRDLLNVARYILLNSTEAAGFLRLDARRMFVKIQGYLKDGRLPRSPHLQATGFS